MRNLLQWLIVFCVLHAGLANAAEDVTASALKAYEKHRYAEAIRLLRQEMPVQDGKQGGGAGLALGMAYLGNAMLYQELYRTALIIEEDYLRQLARQKTSQPSRYVDLYLGQVLSESGKTAEAQKILKRFAAQKNIPDVDRYRAMIEERLAHARYRKGKVAGWPVLDNGSAELGLLLSGAYAVTGMIEGKPVESAESVRKKLEAGKQKLSPRMNRDLLRAYVHGGAVSRALDHLDGMEMDASSHVEELGRSKSISFYDTSLIGDMAKGYLSASIGALEKAANDESLSGTAAYYLATAYFHQGNADRARKNAEKVMSHSLLPLQSKNMAQAVIISADYMQGKRSQAVAAWGKLADKSPEDPVLQATIISACTHVGADCSSLVQKGVSLTDKGEGKKFFVLNSAIGRYFLLRKDFVRAFQYLEAGRDKANKNKIEANDPMMLTSLAEACYRNRKYSESLEIYFELGRHFPVVRQMQDAMQGIYAVEQKSAGEVKIF